MDKDIENSHEIEKDIIDTDFSSSPYIGEFAGKVISLSVGEACIEIYRTNEGMDCSVGTGLVIDCGDLSIFVKVVSISGNGGDKVFTAIAKFVCTIDFSNDNIFNGVANSPFIGADTFYSMPELVEAVSQSTGRGGNIEEGNAHRVELDIASIKGSGGLSLKITPESLFGRHACVVGSTGSGKSWTMAKVIEETSKFESKSILIDATGEYKNLDCDVVHIYFGHDPNPHPESREVVMPYFQLSENDLFGIFEPRGESQGPKLKSAIESLKLSSLVPSLALDGVVIKAHKSKNIYLEALKTYGSQISAGNIRFNIDKLPRQIENECVLNSRSSLESMAWGEFNSLEQSNCIPLVSRVSDLISSQEMSPIFSPESKLSVLDAIEWFLSQPKLKILRISMEFLSHANNVREIVTNAIARDLMNRARKYAFKEKPTILFIDEAHQFIDVDIQYYGGGYKLDSIDSIAKEARKYGLSLCLATQRPKDIPESLLSQMGTMIVHRLTNNSDRSIIERASSKVDLLTLESIPVLAPGEAILLGTDFVDPVNLSMTAPKSPPESANSDFQKYWMPS